MSNQRSIKNPTASILSLPDELLLICIARVSRLYYFNLSLVSKRFKSLLVSTELYRVRSILGTTESCLYVCIKFHPDDYDSWYTLVRKPDETRTNDKSGYVLAKVPVPYSSSGNFSSLVAVGYNIYNICRYRVSVLDCRTHTWLEGPSLPVRLWEHTASVVDQRVYVAGRSSLESSLHVLDRETQVWSTKAIPKLTSFTSKSASVDGKFHVKTSLEVVAYDSEECRWDTVGVKMGVNMVLDCYCDIDNVLYSAFDGAFRWYDTKVGEWKEVMGLVDGLPKFAFPPSGTPCACVRLAGCGGKMSVLWEECGVRKKKIWCAEIALERRESGEIWGRIEWFDQVLEVPRFCAVVKALTATV